jgi:hypothetical protein
LTDLVYELSISPTSVAKLISPAGLVIIALDGLDGGPIPNGNEVNTMFISAITDEVTWGALDPGEVVTAPEFQVKTQTALGNATIKCTLHATIDQASLFPPEQGGTTVKRTLTVS